MITILCTGFGTQQKCNHTRKPRSQSGLFCHDHTTGTSAIGSSRFAHRRYSRKRYYGLYRCGCGNPHQPPISVERNNNISVYKAFEHQHLDEIFQSIHQLQPGFAKDLNFIPVRGNFARGIFATTYTKFAECSRSRKDLPRLLQ